MTRRMSDILNLDMRARKRVPEPTSVRPLVELVSTQPPRDWPESATFEKEMQLATKAFYQAHPFGLTREELSFDLTVEGDINRVCAEKLASNPRMVRYLEARYSVSDLMGKQWTDPLDVAVLAAWLKDHGHELHLYELERFCSFAEIAALVHGSFVSGPLQNEVYKHPLQMYVHKLALSSWHWYTPYDQATHRLSWQKMVNFHRVMTGFELGLPGFEVTVDHSHHFCNKRGWAEYLGSQVEASEGSNPRTWIDGELAFMISYQGEHVMTVGVSPTNAGLLVNQIQLKSKKGNRWLYKLPKPHFEYVLGRLLAVCEANGEALYLVTGESLSREIKALYKDRVFSKQSREHIIRIYNQPLSGLTRVPCDLKVNGHHYTRIVAA